jgi:sec-independent protein translocase protein TatB
MLDMSWGEMMVIGAVALIVIGPKDLPKALRTLGNMTAKIRRMAAEFQGQFNEAMREAELDDVKRQIQGMNDSVGALNQGFNPIQTARDELKGAIEAPAAPLEPTAAANGRATAAEERHAASLPAPAEPATAAPIASMQPGAADRVDEAEAATAYDPDVPPGAAEMPREKA